MNYKNSTNKPDFICIGATKAGTTWLFDRLKELPDFEMPKRKEIGYFDRNTYWTFSKPPLQINKLKNRILSLNWLKIATYNLLHIKSYKSLRFWVYWYLSNYNDDWYKGLFSNKFISGDITPSYALLDNKDISAMKKLNPDTKIIYMLRNPIERDWSQYRMMNKEDKSTDEIINYLEKEDTYKRSEYRNNLLRYLNHFDSSQVLVVFFDALIEKPDTLLKEILDFLNVKRNTNYINKYCSIKSKSNVSRKSDLPKEVEQYLRDYYKNDIKHYSDVFGGYATVWFNNYYSLDEKNNTNLKATISGKILDKL